jgi:hypothetical protein
MKGKKTTPHDYVSKEARSGRKIIGAKSPSSEAAV